jgi:GWxTD domain-containing protein
VGFLRPVILVPAGLFTGLAPEQLEYILLHELAHIRRNDYLVNLLQTAVEGLLFYHPAVWWISGVVRAEREHCCDDLAAEQGDAAAYAEALAGLEQFRHTAQAAVVAATGGNLMKRIQRLLYPSDRPRAALTPILAALAVLGFAGISIAYQDNSAANETPWQKWEKSDVAYIITDAERAAFARLTSDAEREHFVEQFWLRRDPTPGTPENEYKTEHYRRITFVNTRFTEAGIPGWKTDRGRIYITYGPPDEIDSHGSAAATYPYEQWRYRWIEGIGTNVIIEFVNSDSSGLYRMTMDPHAKEKAN